MRYLRLSLYGDPRNPLTTVVRESDLIDTLESIRERQVREINEGGGFACSEIFEGADALEEVTVAAAANIDREHERHLAIAFFWYLGVMQSGRQNAVILPNPLGEGYPAPMSGDEAWDVFEQMTRAPTYRPDIRAEIHCQDGTKLQVHEGKVSEL